MLTAVIRARSAHNHTVEHVWITFYTRDKAGNAGCVTARLGRFLPPWAEDTWRYAFHADVVSVERFELPPAYAGLVLFDVAIVPEISLVTERPKRLTPKKGS